MTIDSCYTDEVVNFEERVKLLMEYNFLRTDFEPESYVPKPCLTERYWRVKSEGCLKLLEKVASGELSIHTAHRMLPGEVMKDLQKADKVFEYVAERVPLLNQDEANRVIRDRLQRITFDLRCLLSKMN